MAIPWVSVPEGTRVRVRQAPAFPQDTAVLGKTGTVVLVSEYQVERVGVVIDGAAETRFFSPQELEILSEPALPAEREAAKKRPPLP
jgi:hypothetical protein